MQQAFAESWGHRGKANILCVCCVCACLPDCACMRVHVCSHMWLKHTPLGLCAARVTLTCPLWSLLSSWIARVNPTTSGGLNSLKQSYNCIFSIIRYLITRLNVLDQAACVNNEDSVNHTLLLDFQKAHHLVNRRRKRFFSFLPRV